MNRNQVSIYILSFLTIFITTTFSTYSLSRFPQLPRSMEERKLAELLHKRISQNNLDEFIRILDTYPKYINIIIIQFHPGHARTLTPLQHATTLGMNELIDELLKRGADPTLTTLSEDSTLLHLASTPRTVKKFIDLGLDLEATNFQGMTPLLVKVFKKTLDREVIHTLLEAGANPNVRTDIAGLTPLHILFKPHHAFHVASHEEDLLTILKDLLARGARVDATTNRDETPLHFAARANNAEAIRILVNRANQLEIQNFINIRDSFGNTPLFIAYKYRSREAITELLKLGANSFLRNNLRISVNGDAQIQSSSSSRETLDFSKFVLDEIAKHFTTSARCAQPLMPVKSNLKD